jgi:hypothetical protein
MPSALLTADNAKLKPDKLRVTMVTASACWPFPPNRTAAQRTTEVPVRNRAASLACADGKNNGLRASGNAKPYLTDLM